jgi:hypothetical protein
MSGLSSFGGGGGYSASSSARSGDSSSGAVGIQIQGITTGGFSPLGAAQGGTGGVPSYVWLAAVALGGLIGLRMLKR